MELMLTFLLFLGMSFLLIWGHKNLPKEKWQFLFSMTKGKKDNGNWESTNFVWYGFFQATANIFGMVIFLFLLGSIGASLTSVTVMLFVVVSFALAGAKLVAVYVEKSRDTFTVGGASFVAIIISPVVLLIINRFGGDALPPLPVLPTLASLATAYAFGESLGRLACLSFGCCYGVPMDSIKSVWKNIIEKFAITFTGDTKKACYEGNLCGKRLFPIQTLTSFLFLFFGATSFFLFLTANFLSAFLVSFLGTQIWRILSEQLRADYRGEGDVSAYQKMSTFAIFYILSIMIFVWFRGTNVTIPNIADGFAVFSGLGLIIFLELFWIFIFAYTGRSTISKSNVQILVNN